MVRMTIILWDIVNEKSALILDGRYKFCEISSKNNQL